MKRLIIFLLMIGLALCVQADRTYARDDKADAGNKVALKKIAQARVRGGARARARARPEKKKKKHNRLIVSHGGRMSPRDIAHLSIAQIHVIQKDFDNAITELTKVTENSPDMNARGAAYFSIGNIYFHKLKDTDHAVEALLQVKGRLAKQARAKVIRIVGRGKTGEETIAILEGLAEVAKTKADEAAVRLTLALYYQRKKDFQAAIAELEKVTAMEYRELHPRRGKPKRKKKLRKTGE